MNWAHAGTAVLAALLASLVEFVEALTIVLAGGTTRGWRSALTGAADGAAVLAVLTLAFGPERAWAANWPQRRLAHSWQACW